MPAIGPVLVFAASNFPFAFSVAGGDTASALAAGCPVVVKAHPGHPGLSERFAELVSAALAGAGAPEGIFGADPRAGRRRAALADPRIQAAAFTGSVGAAAGRCSTSPRRVRARSPSTASSAASTRSWSRRAAAAARADEIADGFVGVVHAWARASSAPSRACCSCPQDHAWATRCPRPSPAGRRSRCSTTRSPRATTPAAQLRKAGAEVVAAVDGTPDAPARAARGHRDEFLADAATLGEECFGPTSLVVTYRDLDQLHALLGRARAQPDRHPAGRGVRRGWLGRCCPA